MVWAIPAIMAAAGLLKSNLVDRPREKRDRALAAETQRYSPWTGLKANPIREADPFGSALQGGMAGMQLGGDSGFTNMFGGGEPAAAGPSGMGAANGARAATTQGFNPSNMNIPMTPTAFSTQQQPQSLYTRLAQMQLQNELQRRG